MIRSPLECKICKDSSRPPVVLVLCCNQMFGCESCFQQSVFETGNCPLCCAFVPRSVPILRQEVPISGRNPGTVSEHLCGLFPLCRLTLAFIICSVSNQCISPCVCSTANHYTLTCMKKVQPSF